MTSPDYRDSEALHDAALRALAEADHALAHAPDLALDGAHTLAELTPGWLARQIGWAVEGAELESVATAADHAGMTSRRKLRLAWNARGQTAGLPEVIFIKATPEEPYHRETLAMLHMHEIEARFYSTLQPEIPHLAPIAYHATSYPGGRFLIILEDLESRGCRPYWQADDCGLDHVRAVVLTLAEFHARYWESDRLTGDLSWVRPRTRRFGAHWHRASFITSRQAFLDLGDESLLPPEAADLLRSWDRHFEQVLDHWDTQPHTVLHGDSHLGNTYATPDGRAGLFDWQVMYAGHGLRDLAYFLMSAMNNDNRILYERAMVDLYLDRLADQGVPLDRDQAWDAYCLYVLDRWDAGIKAYTRGSYGHARSGQIRSLTSTVGSLLDNDAVGRLASLARKL